MNFFNIRVFFSKTKNAKYISHLDLYRAMGRAIKRSALPVWITEGFNPHIYMTFALPLALGIESREESMDLRLIGEDSGDSAEFEKVAEKLNSVMPSGLNIIRVAAPVRKANEIMRARYRIYTEKSLPLDEYFSQPEIKIIKKTKRSARTIDVKPLLEWNKNDRVLTLPTGNTLNINPWNALAQVEVDNVERVEILCEDGELFL